MRTWKRADVLLLCGGPCHGEIQAGEPVRIVTITGVTRPLIRCARCAGEEPPPDMPAMIQQAPIQPTRMLKLAAPAGLDFKMSQAGER